MAVSIEAIKSLREKTGAPMGSVRSALEEAGGDAGKAAEILKKKGFEAARKRAERSTGAGRIEAYVHHDGRVAALVEVNCETDFVGRTPEFQQFCRDVAMQVASQNPLALRQDELTPQQLAEAKGLGKTAEQFAKEACLLNQPFIKDQGLSIEQYLTDMIAKTGENIVVKRFLRFGLGDKT